LIGQTFGRLTVVRQGYRPSGHKSRAKYWACRCSCGTEKNIRADGLLRGAIKSCGCLQREGTFKNKYGGSPARNALVSNYRLEARKRGLPFELTHEQCEHLFLEKCFYCKVPPSQSASFGHRRQYTIVHNGIDRVDNTKGYLLGNVVPCCKTCNSAKGTLSLSDFKKWIAKISTFLT